MEQKDDETPQEYLNRFLRLMNQIHDLDSKQAVVSFTHGLIPGSLLSDKLLEDFPRDMNVVIQKAKGIFRVLESRPKIAISIALISTPNASVLVPQPRKSGNKINGQYDLAIEEK